MFRPTYLSESGGQGQLAPRLIAAGRLTRMACVTHMRGARRARYRQASPYADTTPVRPARFEGCDRVSDGQGLCSGHRQRLRIWGELRLEVPLREWKFTPGDKCLFAGCPTPSATSGLCRRHFDQKYQAKRRALRRGATIEAFEPHEVFDRDGWICQICDQPIDTRARHPDPRSVSLDHIVPLSRGGEHSRANCQTAHLICNLKKGARLDGDFGERASA